MDKLIDFLEKLPSKVLVSIMLKSLDRMQYYNGQTIEHCILNSINGELVEEGYENWMWKLPSLKKLIEDNQTMIL